MCGILGASFHTDSINTEVFKGALDMLSHRGPDTSGVWFNNSNNDALGFKRLSIIDLTRNGDQPLSSSCGNYKIIFNGEIYNFKEIRHELKLLNYKFYSSSDTEVLLNAYIHWGSTALKKFNGMFSFAIYDQVQKKIFLARDPAGEKPLFYSMCDGDFMFASELKPLLNYSKKSKSIDMNSFSYLFQNGYTPKSKSIFSNINKLKAGHSLVFDLKTRSPEIKKYWDVPTSNVKKFYNLSEDHLVSQLEQHLQKSVELQLNSDVPVGILLSGGLDSSLITSIASRYRDEINTFTVSFDGHGAFDEAPFAKLIADKFSTKHHLLDAKEVNPEIIEKLTFFYDDPIFDPSMIPSFFISEAISKNFKVALSGDGGDELFGGYNHYLKLIQLKNLSSVFPLRLRQALNYFAQNIMPLGTKGRKTIELFSTDFSNFFANTNEFFSGNEHKKFFQNDTQEDVMQGMSSHRRHNSNSDYIFDITANDFQHYLSEDLLVKMDRASMANSIEIRAPFLDRDLIQFAFNSVPSALKVNKRDQKILLKKLASKILPDSFDVNRKQGFAIPLVNFLQEKKWQDYFHQTIIDSDSKLIDKYSCLKLMKDKDTINKNAGRLFGLIFFIHWYKRFGLELYGTKY